MLNIDIHRVVKVTANTSVFPSSANGSAFRVVRLSVEARRFDEPGEREVYELQLFTPQGETSPIEFEVEPTLRAQLCATPADTTPIPAEELTELRAAARELAVLKKCGVQQWAGYADAMLALGVTETPCDDDE